MSFRAMRAWSETSRLNRPIPVKTHPGSLTSSPGMPSTSASRYHSIRFPPTRPLSMCAESVKPDGVAGHGRRSVHSRRRISMPRALSTVRRRSILIASSAMGAAR